VTPKERVFAITEIADGKQDSDWADIELVLAEFKVPPPKNFEGGKRDYLIGALRQASDEQLDAVRDYIRSASASPEPAVGADNRKLPWDEGQFRLFASHRADDKYLVTEVKKRLAAMAVNLFIAHADIDPTAEWLEQIDLALDSCDALAAFLTPNFHMSNWCDQEVGFAMRRRVHIIPVDLGVTPYGFMGKYQALKADASKPQELADAIYDILVTHELTRTRMSEALVAYVAEAQSFDQANSGAKRLNRVSHWTPELLRRLEESLEGNRQVSGSFAVPGIKSIIARHSGAAAKAGGPQEEPKAGRSA
jgi:hypothetical protein